jgi:hypothetical protein
MSGEDKTVVLKAGQDDMEVTNVVDCYPILPPGDKSVTALGQSPADPTGQSPAPHKQDMSPTQRSIYRQTQTVCGESASNETTAEQPESNKSHDITDPDIAGSGSQHVNNTLVDGSIVDGCSLDISNTSLFSKTNVHDRSEPDHSRISQSMLERSEFMDQTVETIPKLCDVSEMAAPVYMDLSQMEFSKSRLLSDSLLHPCGEGDTSQMADWKNVNDNSLLPESTCQLSSSLTDVPADIMLLGPPGEVEAPSLMEQTITLHHTNSTEKATGVLPCPSDVHKYQDAIQPSRKEIPSGRSSDKNYFCVMHHILV